MLDGLKARLRLNEGIVRYMYLDTKGNVAVGIGHLLATANDAAELPFLKPGSGPPPTAQDIRYAWQTIRQMKPGMPLVVYSMRCIYRLDAKFVDDLLDRDIQAHLNSARVWLPEIATYPEPAQEAILDIDFNCIGGIGGFPVLCVFAKAGNWGACANNCHREGASESRNKSTRELFLQAAQEDAKAEVQF